MDKKVSIIIPCFNQEKYVIEAIESALWQTYKNIEILCVNDGSIDNSSLIIKDFADKFKNIVFFDLEENKGVIYARNLAIGASTGEYILPLDADDVIEPTYVEKAVEILNNKPEIGIVYCNARLFGFKNRVWKLPDFSRESFLYDNCIFNCALFRKKDFYNAGLYKENMIDGCEDWDLWLSIIELGLKPYRINEVLFNYRKCEKSRSSEVNKNSAWKNELIKNHLDLYLKDLNFGKRVFLNSDRIEKKEKKYKSLFKFFFISFVLVLGILLWIIV